MANSKVSALTAATSCAATDVFYLTADPGGTPLSRKIEVDDIFKRGTLTTDVKVIDASATWNNAAVTFTAAKVNVTGTAYAANSAALDLQVDSSSIFYVRPAVISGTAYSGRTEIGLTQFSYMVRPAGGFMTIGPTTASGVGMNDAAFLLGSTGYIAFTSFTDPQGTRDTYLYRDAANTLALRNSTNAQTFRVYNTGDSSNGEWAGIKWDANIAYFFTSNAGTGTSRSLELASAASIYLRAATAQEYRFYISSGLEWRMSTSAFYPGTDSADDIGTTSNKVRKGYFDALDGSALACDSLPTSDPAVAGRLYTQTATQLGGSGTTPVVCVSAG